MRKLQIAGLILFLLSGALFFLQIIIAIRRTGSYYLGYLFDIIDIDVALAATFTLIIANLASLATFIVTTIYQLWDERRQRVTYELNMEKMRLEIEKLRRELEEAPQKEKKRRP